MSAGGDLNWSHRFHSTSPSVSQSAPSILPVARIVHHSMSSHLERVYPTTRLSTYLQMIIIFLWLLSGGGFRGTIRQRNATHSRPLDPRTIKVLFHRTLVGVFLSTIKIPRDAPPHWYRWHSPNAPVVPANRGRTALNPYKSCRCSSPFSRFSAWTILGSS